MRILLIIMVLASGAPGFAASSATRNQPHCRATLLSERNAVRAGEAFTLGVLLEADEHWHTYWRNPGDSGLATRISWQLPEGFEASAIQWPTPALFVMPGPTVNFGYEGTVLLPVTLTAPETIATTQVTFEAEVRWLVCNPSLCVPGSAKLSLTLPVTDQEPALDPTVAVHFARARAATPMPLVLEQVAFAWSDGREQLKLVFDVPHAIESQRQTEESGKATKEREKPFYFFPQEVGTFEEPAIEANGHSVEMLLPLFDPDQPLEHVQGVLKLDEHSYQLDVPLSDSKTTLKGASP